MPLGCSEAPDSTTGQAEPVSRCDWPVEAYETYNHPLLGVPLVKGRVPGVDVHESPSGRRYAIVTGATQLTEGAPPNEVSSVVELEWDWMTPEERAQEPVPPELVAALANPPAPTKRFSDLEQRLATASPNEPLDLSVSVVHESDGGIVLQLMRAIGEGRVTTFAEREVERMRLLEQRAQAVRKAIEPVRMAVEAMGGKVRPAVHQFRVGITVPAAKVTAVEALPAVESIGMEDFPIEPASRQNRVREAEQVNQYVKPIQPVAVFDGYDRSTWTAPIWTVGFGEGTAPDDEHAGFKDLAGGGFNIVRMYRRECNDTSCWSVANFLTEHPHPTACLGLVLGDLEDGQDPNVSNLTTREERSGYAPEAWGRVYAVSGGSGWYRLLEDAVGSSPPTPIINSSNGGDFDIPGCLGRTQLDLVHNGAFEDGTLVFWAGGNNYGHAHVPPECTVAGPKGPGVFKVGTFGAVAGETAPQIRTAPVSNCSPRGGVSYDQGRSRTLVDLVGYGNYEFMFSADGAYNFQSIGGATSQATATVSGMAADLVHWFRIDKGYLPSPGELRTLLLLMGDRQTEAGKLTTLFSNLWGAGRLKLRRFDESGLDVPWSWNLGQTCVGHGQNVYVNLGTIPNGVDVVKAVAYWYDPRTVFAPPLGVEVPDDINLRLQAYTAGTWTTVKASTSLWDPRERVYAVPATNVSHRLQITGSNVTADTVGCGTNSMKVYYAYFYEDSARNDADGPGAEIEPE